MIEPIDENSIEQEELKKLETNIVSDVALKKRYMLFLYDEYPSMCYLTLESIVEYCMKYPIQHPKQSEYCSVVRERMRRDRCEGEGIRLHDIRTIHGYINYNTLTRRRRQ